jgi:NAD(P)-dependent dehydrogenase (short-subunit alcohol dehydrogenase family)
MILSDKVAVITGGARGIGKGIALKFVEEGGSVAIADILEKEARQTVEEITRSGGKAIYLNCDVSNKKQVQEMMQQTINQFGQIDILVNDAGTGYFPKKIVEVSEEEWDRTLAVNLKGVFLCCQAVVPYMKEKKYGKIINMSSLSAISPVHPISYTSSKGGVMTFTIDLAMELAPCNICVNAIMPGLTRTDMVDEFVPPGKQKDEFYDQIAKAIIPMERVGTPLDIARVALFLASPLSDYVTGDRIIVGGGSPWRSHL